MKTQNFTTWVLATGLLATVALADSPSVTSPPAPGAVGAPSVAPSQIVYTPQLPGVAELASIAAAQGATIKQIIQSARDLNVTYQMPDNQVKTVVYQLLTEAGTNPVQAPAPTFIDVNQPVPGAYYDPYDPYISADWYLPVSLRLGLGFGARGGHR